MQEGRESLRPRRAAQGSQQGPGERQREAARSSTRRLCARQKAAHGSQQSPGRRQSGAARSSTRRLCDREGRRKAASKDLEGDREKRREAARDVYAPAQRRCSRRRAVRRNHAIKRRRLAPDPRQDCAPATIAMHPRVGSNAMGACASAPCACGEASRRWTKRDMQQVVSLREAPR